MTCPPRRTTCYTGIFGDQTCRTTTDHPGYARTTCRRGLFGDRCTTRYVPPTQESTTCYTGLFGNTNCRTSYFRPYSFGEPSYSTYFSYGYDRDPYYSAPRYRTYTCGPLGESDSLSSFVLGILGVTFLAAAFSL